MSEDCLYLNVWTPARSPDDGRSWVRRGSTAAPSSAVRGPWRSTLARAWHVAASSVVTINYRLGALGFPAHPALTAELTSTAPETTDLWDQLAALRWVRYNIAASAATRAASPPSANRRGPSASSTWMASPLSEGLLQRAIVQSAILWEEDSLGPRTGGTMDDAELRGLAFARQLGVPRAPTRRRRRRCVPCSSGASSRRRPPRRTSHQRAGLQAGGRRLRPSRERASRAFATGRLDIPLLVGSNADEEELFVAQAEDLTVAYYIAFTRRA